MWKNQFNHFLRAEATEFGDGGGGGSAVAAVKTGAEAQAGETAAKAEDLNQPPGAEGVKAEKGAEPTRLQVIAASFKDKGVLIAERDAAVTRATTAEAQLEGLQARLSLVQGELSAKTVELGQIDAALKAAQSANQTVDEAAAKQVASHGFGQEKLPEGQAQEDTVEAMTARMNAETNPGKKWELAEKINAVAFGLGKHEVAAV